MQAIIDFFAAVGEVITSVISFVIKLFQDLIYMVQLLGQFVLDIPSYFSWLPGEVVALIVTIFSIVVIYKLLGREG